MKILVAGAGGFIGGHLVNNLMEEGHDVRAVDKKPPAEWHQWHGSAYNLTLDLANLDDCRKAVQSCEQVYNLAADMGGMGFIENNKSQCMLSVLINTHLLMASEEATVERYFYASSACVYAADKQNKNAQEQANFMLKEEDAYPAEPEDGYGWEKLFSERMCRHFMEDHGLEVRVARYHNVYGPHGTWDGGREKAPAAICRKVLQAHLDDTHTIDIWGDGNQLRSFMYITDCIEGTRRLMASNIHRPLNIGSEEMVTINKLVDIAENHSAAMQEDDFPERAVNELFRKYDDSKPVGVHGRCSDNLLVRELLDWEPAYPLNEGMLKTLMWIKGEMEKEVSGG
jgi:GDP-D-mannose 3',5'-epimerase